MDVPRTARVVSSGNMDIPGVSTSVASAQASTSSRSHRDRERANRPRDRHVLALKSIRDFLKGRSSYDVLPVSFRLIVLDTKLVVKPALEVMWQAGVVSAPLWQSTPPSLLGNNAADSQSSDSTAAERTQDDTETMSHKKTDLKAHQMSGFAGMLTVNDIIHLIQYYYHHSSYDSVAQDVETFRLERLRDIEQALNVPPPPLLSVHPLRPLFDACQLLIKTHARRLPLLDYDEQTGMETVVSVLTQYRVLKFIAMNCRETASLWRSLRHLNIGTYCHSFKAASASQRPPSGASSHRGSDASEPGATKAELEQTLNMSEVASGLDSQGRRESNASTSSTGSELPSVAPETDSSNPFAPLATATLDTTVFDVVHMFSEQGISAVPILDEDGNVVDMYETVDVITLVRTGAYTALDLTIRQALERRPPDFSGVWTCSPDDSLASIFALLRKRRVHRLLVLEPEVTPPSDAKADPTTPLEDLEDAFPDDLVEDAAQRERDQTNRFLNDPSAPLDDRLEKGDPVRKSRGKLVGMVCLSDILRYVIGDSTDLAGNASERRGSNTTSRSRGTSVASSLNNGSSIPLVPSGLPAAAAPSPTVQLETTPVTPLHPDAAHTVTSPSTHLDATATIPEEP